MFHELGIKRTYYFQNVGKNIDYNCDFKQTVYKVKVYNAMYELRHFQ